MIVLFYEYEDSNFASYADDTTPYSYKGNIVSVSLRITFQLV